VLSNVTGKHIQTLLCKDSPFSHGGSININPFVNIIENRSEYIKTRSNIITSAKKSLWIQLRTAHYMEQYALELINVMRRGVKVRLLSCDPNDPLTMEMMARRKYPMHSTRQESEEVIHTAIERVKKDMRANQISGELFKVRVMAFFPATAIYIADPYPYLDPNNDGKYVDNGTLFAVTPVYKVDPYCAPFILANRSNHETIYDAYRRQFAALWHAATKYEGRNSKAAKKTALQSLIKSLKSPS
jgi:hypothetical protein